MHSKLNFSGLNVLIIGDVMVDFYLFGEVNRISPEAPVPVVEILTKEPRPGGAANVALNVLGLGANPILLTMIGRDATGNILIGLLKELDVRTNHVLQHRGRMTSLKTRVFDEDKQVVRFDEEDVEDLDDSQENLLIKEFRKILANEKVDMIIMQDYNKGVLTKYFIFWVIDTVYWQINAAPSQSYIVVLTGFDVIVIETHHIVANTVLDWLPLRRFASRVAHRTFSIENVSSTK